ncbi:MAG: HlyD family efflux transporter periplasmic adaptor subunit [Acidobacteriota bacterium]
MPESTAHRTRASRRWLWLVGGLVLIGLIGFSMRPAPLAVDLASVERGPLEVTLDEEGETRVRDRYVVSAPLAGRVLRVELEPGDPVTAGTTRLATFQPSDPTLLDARAEAEARARVRAADASLGLARAERERAAAELDFAQAELRRIERLAADEIVSTERLDSAALSARTRQEALEAAEFAVRTAEHELELARATLLRGSGGGSDADGEPIVLTAPIDGVVLKRLQESEAVVAAGTPLLELGDPRRLEIVADFLSTDAVQIDSGDAVRIEQWGGEHAINGRVRRVEPSGFTKISALGVEEQRVNVVIDFEDPESAWQALGDGYRVEVLVVIWSEDDVLQVPASALFRRGDAWAVYRLSGDTATETAVEIGRRTGLIAQVLGGLDAGDEVIVHPSDAVDDGVQVEPR